MREADDAELEARLSSAAPMRGGAAEGRVFAVVWARVGGSIADGTEPRDDLQSRRLDLVADRQISARRRQRAARVASLTLAVAVAGAGTAAAATDFFSAHTGQELKGW